MGGRAALAGFRPDGRVDPTFGVNGRVTTDLFEPTTLAVQPDGRLLLTALSPNSAFDTLLRFDPSGALDPKFGSGGAVMNSLGGEGGQWKAPIALQRDGRIVVLGGAFNVYRFWPEGGPDGSFGAGGRVSMERGRDFHVTNQSDLLVQPDGKLSSAACT